MMMLGERVPAATALDWGMIWQVVPDAELMATARALAARLAAGPTRTYGLIRQGVRAAMDSSLTEALAIERGNQRTAGRTADFAEGVAAFLAKRPAKFTGK
jgi:2-(1,2-epoxy-1,2-dihydrophenyl)acetyl-CoA isomerase